LKKKKKNQDTGAPMSNRKPSLSGATTTSNRGQHQAGKRNGEASSDDPLDLDDGRGQSEDGNDGEKSGKGHGDGGTTHGSDNNRKGSSSTSDSDDDRYQPSPLYQQFRYSIHFLNDEIARIYPFIS
jgi:hypothetical protein